jgi:DNA polymerase III epsilon subunit-like protein
MLIFLDTETTDKEKDSRLVQLAYKIRKTGETVNVYFKPPVEISIGAMAVHHVTNEMVEDKPAFDGSQDKNKLIELLEEGILIAHNALFDINILNNEGVSVPQFIDTYKLSQHLIESDRYALQYLRYLLKLKIEGEDIAHNAMGDVNVLEQLFEYLFMTVKDKFELKNDQDVVDKMIELTKTPVLIKKFVFGKYFGREFEEVATVDKGYLEWLYKTESAKSPFDQNEDMLYTLEHYLKIDPNELPF